MYSPKAYRSKEAPMDFEYTSRPSASTVPAWSASAEDPTTPKKRNHDTLLTVTPLNTPKFGANPNVPFIFHNPMPESSTAPYPWSPSTPSRPASLEIFDVDMPDASPPTERPTEPESPSTRAVATGALKRVYRSRQKIGRGKISRLRNRIDNEDAENSPASDIDDEDDDDGILAQKTSHHYTLNMPSPTAPRTEVPVLLLGYIQVFFNLSLILIFLYLIVLLILTVQRDVEHRISEYSMESVQEIASCALRFKENSCLTPVPAMEKLCSSWSVCMNRDPTKIGRAQISAEMIAEIFNSFVDAISWKTLLFSLSSLSFLTIFVNSLLSLYRSRHHDNVSAHSPNPPILPIPATPYTPHHIGGYLSPASTPGWGRGAFKGLGDDSIDETPTRKRRLVNGGAINIK